MFTEFEDMNKMSKNVWTHCFNSENSLLRYFDYEGKHEVTMKVGLDVVDY